MLLSYAPVVTAALTSVGPTNPVNGFPLWYRDANGVALELPVPPFGTPEVGGNGGVEPIILPPTMVFDPPAAAPSFSATIGFGTEADYFSCTAVGDAAGGKLNDAAGNPVVFVLSLTATFIPDAQNVPVVQDGNQVVFSRLRIRYRDAPVAGTYTLEHPYGTERIIVTANDVARKKGINITRDVPVLAPLNFTGALAGDVGPFLTQLSPPPVITPGTPAPFDTGWIGDGVTPATITGSPINFNKIRLTGPAGSNIGVGGQDFIETDLFITSGHQYQAAPGPGTPGFTTPLTVNAVTFNTPTFTFRPRNNLRLRTTINIFAASANTATVTATTPAAPLPAAARITSCAGPAKGCKLTNDGAGNFYGKIKLPRGAAIPETVSISATSPDGDVSTTWPVTDTVQILEASYSSSWRVLHVRVRSTAQKATFKAANISEAFNKNRLAVDLPQPIASVTVTSSFGGSATAPVIIVP